MSNGRSALLTRLFKACRKHCSNSSSICSARKGKNHILPEARTLSGAHSRLSGPHSSPRLKWSPSLGTKAPPCRLVCVCVLTYCSTWQSEEEQDSALCSFHRELALRIELRQPGLHSKCFYLLPAEPSHWATSRLLSTDPIRVSPTGRTKSSATLIQRS